MTVALPRAIGDSSASLYVGGFETQAYKYVRTKLMNVMNLILYTQFLKS